MVHTQNDVPPSNEGLISIEGVRHFGCAAMWHAPQFNFFTAVSKKDCTATNYVILVLSTLGSKNIVMGVFLNEYELLDYQLDTKK